MREVTNKVYTFDELSEDAQERALGEIVRVLEQGWDSGDNEDVRDTIVYTFAQKLHSPGWHTFGPVDFPGVDGVTVDGWSMDRYQALAMTGTLTRDNAPALPWNDDIDHVVLKGWRSDSTSVDVIATEGESTHEESDPDGTPLSPRFLRSALKQVVHEALSEAWADGEREADYKTSTEYARELATDQYEFNIDGTLWHN